MKKPIVRVILSILASLFLLFLFFAASIFIAILVPDPTAWNYASGAHRLITGIAAAVIFALIFGKSRLKEVFGTRGLIRGLLPSIPLLIFCFLSVSLFFIGLRGFSTDNTWLFVGDVFFISIMTSIFEEITIRGLIIEGYFHIRHKNRLTRLIFLLLSAAVFTLCHTSYYNNPLMLFYLFALGLSLASIYIFSQNLMLCTVLHILYDVSVCARRYSINDFSTLQLVFYMTITYLYIFMAAAALVFILIGKPYRSSLKEAAEDLSSDPLLTL